MRLDIFVIRSRTQSLKKDTGAGWRSEGKIQSSELEMWYGG
jgi:hypothetical protein